MPVLSFRDVTLDFAAGGEAGRALAGVTFDVGRGRTTALVGESGSGKSSLALAAMGLLPPHARLSGSILLDDGRGPAADLAALDPGGRDFRRVRGGRIGLVFQEPLSAFSPVHTVGSQIAEAARAHENVGRAAARARTVEILRLTGFADPERGFDAYPFELSGGLRQRAMIAIALACRPRLLIADEPTTALDVTVQAQILSLLGRLRRVHGMSMLLVTHDLGVVARETDRVAVMYLGRIVESASTAALFARPLHPYTAALMRSIPRLGQTRRRLAAIPGNVPDPSLRPSGCSFHPRCPLAEPVCGKEDPALEELQSGHFAACHVARREARDRT